MLYLRWIAIGLVAGAASGTLFGWAYMLAGAGIGVAGGLGIAVALRQRVRAGRRNLRQTR